MATTYEPIATTTLGSNSTTIAFSSIPNTYTDLRLVLVGTVVTANTNIAFTLNGSTTGYSFTYLSGNGSTAKSSAATSAPAWYPTFENLGSTTIPCFYTLDIFSYAGSTHKSSLFTANQDQNGSGAILQGVGLWQNTNAITSITATQTSNFAIGTTATLYGIKAA